jgi:hypothetical protein
MTIQPTRSPMFYGTDPVAGAVRAVLGVDITTPADHASTGTGHAAPLDLEALYPNLFPPAQPARGRWTLRRLVLQH